MKKSLLALAVLIGVLASARLISNHYRPTISSTEGIMRQQWAVMGILWSAQIIHHGHPDAAIAAFNKVEAELHHIDNVMSEWKAESPLSAINDAAGKSLVEVPQDLREIIQRSIRYSEASNGAFDVTWRSMGRIWRFDDQFKVPTKEAAAKARTMINYRDIEIEGNKVGLKRAGMSIGLGGIAKGYAIDRAAQIIASAGFTDFLVDGSGDILVSGTKLGQPWLLGIQHPRAERGTLLGTVELTKGVLVTSGDYERFKMVNGVRYHHIIDPSTGYPATACQSVTVIAPTAEQAVVLAKVIFMQAPEKGLALAIREGLEAYIVDKDGNPGATPGFPKFR